MDIERQVNAFLNTRATRSKGTASTYGAGIKKWLEWAAEHEMDPISTEAIVSFHASLLHQIAPATRETYMAAIAGFLDYLVISEHEHNVNMLKVRYAIRNAPESYSDQNVYALDELRKREMPRLVEHFENYPIPEENDEYNHRLTALRNVALFWTLYETACRIGEAHHLDRRQIRRDGKIVIVPGKGNKPHRLRFGYPEHRAIPAILRYLKERKDTGTAVFVSHSRNSNGKRLSTTSLTAVITKEMRALGFVEQLTPHDIRHYRAAMMLKQDVPLHVIQQFLNHSDIGTTRRFYAPITDEEDMRRHLGQLSA